MKLVVGILGAGKVAPIAMVGPAKRRNDVSVHAVASRRIEKAQAFAMTHGIPKAYGSYDELIADPEITLVYCALPPSEHMKWSIAALNAGKHVLCEKPIAMNADEAEELGKTAADAGRQVIEAFHDRYHPAYRHLVTLARTRVGAIRYVNAEVSLQATFDPDSFRYRPETGGGALMEFGCYPVRWLRDIPGQEPSVSSARGVPNSLGADSSMEAVLEYPSGARGTLLADGLSESPGVKSRITVLGSRGKVVMEDPILPRANHAIHEWIDGKYHVSKIGAQSSYDYQLEALTSTISANTSALTGAADFIPNMALIDQIYAAAGWKRDATWPNSSTHQQEQRR